MWRSLITPAALSSLAVCLSISPVLGQQKAHGCGRGAPPIGGPFVNSDAPDEDYSLDGCYAIEDEDVVRLDEAGRTLWRTQVGKSLGGVRPPHVVHDDDRVYVSDGDGITALDSHRGALLWHTKSPNERMLLSGKMVVGADCGSGAALEAEGHWMFGLAIETGRILFRTRLPRGMDDPLPIREVGGLLLVQQRSFGRDSTGGAILVDQAGRTRLQLREYVLQGICQDDDLILLLSGRIVRLTPSGRTRWEIRCAAGELDGGDLLLMPGGDLLVLYFGRISDSGVNLLRVSPEGGSVKWTTACKPLGVSHSLYRHWAAASLEARRIVVTSHGSYGSFVEWLDAGTGKHLQRSERTGSQPQAQGPPPRDWIDKVRVDYSGFRPIGTSHTYVGTLVVTNVSSEKLPAPVSLVLWPRIIGQKLVEPRPSGFTIGPWSKPYFDLPVGESFDPGESIRIPVRLVNDRQPVEFGTVLLAGPGKR